MGLLIDGSTPVHFGDVQSAINVDSTSPAFTAPSGALLVVCMQISTPTAISVTHSVADSGGLIWTERKHADAATPAGGGNGGSASIWTALTTSAVSRTVTIRRTDQSGSMFQNGKVFVVTGQHASPIGNSTAVNNTVSNVVSLTLTTSATNSLMFASMMEWTPLGDPTSSDLTLDNFTNSGDSNFTGAYKACPSSGAQTGNIDYPGTTASQVNWVTLEIIAAAAAVSLLLGDYTIDQGLAGLDTVCDKIYICAATPTSYSDATSGANSLGNKNWGAGNAFGSPAAGTGARQITSIAITDGNVTANGTVAAWAAVDSANSRLLASGPVTGGIAVTNGQVFTLGALTFNIPNT